MSFQFKQNCAVFQDNKAVVQISVTKKYFWTT